MPTPVRIRISALASSPDGEPKDARFDFWQPYISEIRERQSIPQLEAAMRSQFGRELLLQLLNHIRRGLSEMDRLAFGFEAVEGYLDSMPNGGEPNFGEVAAVFSRFLDVRKQLISENSAYAVAIRRLGDAAGLLISVTIRGYSSLNLDLEFSPINKLASAFESDFDSFRVFLEVFIPKTIGEIYSPEFAELFSYTIDIPEDIKRAFLAAPQPARQPEKAIRATSLSGEPSGTDSQERAKWLWRLANGSLVVPVVLALVVLYFGWQEMSSLRAVQERALESALDHQQELLKEDRRRLEAFQNPKTGATSAVQSSTNAATSSLSP